MKKQKLLIDTGENVQKWTRVFSTRRWVILVARTGRKKREENSVSTFGRFRLWTSFESSSVSVNSINKCYYKVTIIQMSLSNHYLISTPFLSGQTLTSASEVGVLPVLQCTHQHNCLEHFLQHYENSLFRNILTDGSSRFRNIRKQASYSTSVFIITRYKQVLFKRWILYRRAYFRQSLKFICRK